MFLIPIFLSLDLSSAYQTKLMFIYEYFFTRRVLLLALVNLLNLPTNRFKYPFTKQHFVLYKQVTSQYHDPDILRYVSLIIPEKIKKDISKSVNCNGYDGNSINHDATDVTDRDDDGDSSSNIYIKDYSSSILLSDPFLNSLKEMMLWYKNDFMRWVDKHPLCDNCGHILYLEYISGITWQVRGIENYYCSFCSTVFSFPRHGKIIEIANNRMGRCSEWAFLFGAMLNSISIKTRIVHDFLDHCWNESFIGGRWIHIDSTLAYPISFDHSLYYENSWNKEYVFVLAFSKSDLKDVTPSYTTKWNQVLDRRSKLRQIQFDKFKNFYKKR